MIIEKTVADLLRSIMCTDHMPCPPSKGNSTSEAVYRMRKKSNRLSDIRPARLFYLFIFFSSGRLFRVPWPIAYSLLRPCLRAVTYKNLFSCIFYIFLLTPVKVHVEFLFKRTTQASVLSQLLSFCKSHTKLHIYVFFIVNIRLWLAIIHGHHVEHKNLQRCKYDSWKNWKFKP